MNRNHFITVTVLSIALLMGSCNDYEKLSVENFDYDILFSPVDSGGINAQGYLLSIYWALPLSFERIQGSTWDMLDFASDDGVSSALDNAEIIRLSTGQYNAQSPVPSEMVWGDYYRAIRRATQFINGIEIVPTNRKIHDGLLIKHAWKAEARVLRAFFYFELVKRYGGVPLLGNNVYYLEDDVEFPRNSFEECINFIVDEIDMAKDSLLRLPLESPAQDGHAVTKQMAMALKSKVLLYAASPLFNGQPLSLPGHQNLMGYADYQEERWKLAADAAKWFIDEYGPGGQDIMDLNPDFLDIFITNVYHPVNNKEVIFWRHHGGGEAHTYLVRRCTPTGFSSPNAGEGRYSPTHDLVEAFPMINGKPVSDPTFNPLRPYDNRDPRLGYTVLYNGSRWLGTTVETFAGGLHNPNDPVQKTKTGYYLRKFNSKIEEERNWVGQKNKAILFRYAELLLNFAEAQNEYSGPDNDVYQAIISLRKRAGIEPGDDDMYGLDPNMTRDEMREIVRNERRIELAFEDHRFYDIRRWRIAQDIYSKPIRGMHVVRMREGFEFTEIPVINVPFNERRYLHPILYTEVIKNRNMVQNPGWE